MTVVVISEKGQITIPASVRKALGLKPKAKLEVEARDNEVVMRPVKSILDLGGSLSKYAKGKTDDWETVRRKTMEAVAAEVAREGME